MAAGFRPPAFQVRPWANSPAATLVPCTYLCFLHVVVSVVSSDRDFFGAWGIETAGRRSSCKQGSSPALGPGTASSVARVVSVWAQHLPTCTGRKALL